MCLRVNLLDRALVLWKKNLQGCGLTKSEKHRYNAPTVLLAGHQQAAPSVHYTTSCKDSLVLLRMGEIIARNMLSCLKLSINLLLFHLVGCLYCCWERNGSIVSSAPDDERNYCPKHVELFEIINKSIIVASGWLCILLFRTKRQHRRCIIPQAINTV